MKEQERYDIQFQTGKVHYLFGESKDALSEFAGSEKVVFITDKNVLGLYKDRMMPHPVICIPDGNKKSWDTIAYIIRELIHLEAHRKTLIVGMGGGTVTDIAGFVASVYMRGLFFGFVPTTLLCMTDASVGGKNGIDFRDYKNMIGTIQQPAFIINDASFLHSLPDEEWSNGFAEIIKYACIFDKELLNELLENDLAFYKTNAGALQLLIQKCVHLKNQTVLQDEREQGLRKLLNFGHTAGHAIEKKYELSHGKAVALGMVIACCISEKTAGLKGYETEKLKALLKRYKLPVAFKINADEVLQILKMDKKKTGDHLDFIVLESLGHATIRNIPYEIVRDGLIRFQQEDAG